MLSVFIVDDEYLIRTGLKQIIPWEDYGFTVVGEAGDAEEALEVIRPEAVDLLITDIRLPEMSGLELCEQLRARYPQIEVIVMTGYDEFELVLKALRAGVVDYILKPISTDSLVGALKQARARLEKRSVADRELWAEKAAACIHNKDTVGLEYTLNLMCGQLREQGLWNSGALLVFDDLLVSVLGSHSKLKFGERYLEEFRAAGLVSPDEGFERLREILKTILRSYTVAELGLVEKAKVYIEEHYQERLTLQSVAEAVYTNAAYLSNLFLQETGDNYKAYVLRVRLRHAKRLLRETNLTVDEISDKTGFGNSKYFAKIFKNKTGKTPTCYRKES